MIIIKNSNVYIWNKDMVYTYADIQDQEYETIIKLGRGKTGTMYLNNYLEYIYKGARVCLKC